MIDRPLKGRRKWCITVHGRDFGIACFQIQSTAATATTNYSSSPVPIGVPPPEGVARFPGLPLDWRDCVGCTACHDGNGWSTDTRPRMEDNAGDAATVCWSTVRRVALGLAAAVREELLLGVAPLGRGARPNNTTREGAVPPL